MRHAEIRTELDDSDAVAAAIRPDNTAQMDTRVEDGAVVTTIARETTGGLRSTVDDYVVNLDVASRTIDAATRLDDTTVRTEGAVPPAEDAVTATGPHEDRPDSTTNDRTDEPNGDTTNP